MPDSLRIALTGLVSYQQALATTSHNITNANTPGYSRQRASLETLQPQFFGGFFFGSGVQVAGVSRIYDSFVARELQRANSNFSEMDVYHQYAARIDELVSNADAGISPGLHDFFQALHVLNDSPASQPARSNFLSQANILVQRFENLSEQLGSLHDLIDLDIRNSVNEINRIAIGISDINRSIGDNQSPAPDLLDKRDQLLNELAKLVEVNTIEQDDGAINVFIGSGQALIVAGSVSQFGVRANSLDPDVLDVTLETSQGSSAVVTDSIQGGKLSGILRTRQEILIPSQNQLGLLAIGLAQTFNEQHHSGMDLNGDLGQDFFQNFNDAGLIGTRSSAAASNSGNAVLNVSIANASAMLASDYELTVNSPTDFVLQRLSDGAVTNFASFPVMVDGVQLSVASGTFSAGDRYKIMPTRLAARDLAMELTQPEQIALAYPISTISSTSNTGTGSISQGVVVNTQTTAFTTTPNQLIPPLRIEFLSSTTYRIVNATTSAVIEGPIAFTPNQTNAVFPTPGAFDPGFRIEITGAPNTGDAFSISYNTNGAGDNRNGLALNALQFTKNLLNNTATYQDIFGSMVSEVGLKTHEADITRITNQTLLDQAEAKRESISGVNLDEEASNMLTLQQGYQAMAQVIQISSSLFQTLIDSF